MTPLGPSVRDVSRGCSILLLSLLIACEGATPSPQPDAEDGPTLQVGVNPTGAEDTTLFEPLAEGAELAIEFGFQGLWMVVLAFQSEGLEGRVTVVARVRTEANVVLGEFGLAKQVLMEAQDGYGYYLNLFLIVEGIDAVGQKAWVELEVEDAHGLKLERTVGVILTRSTLDSGALDVDVNGRESDAMNTTGDVGPEPD